MCLKLKLLLKYTLFINLFLFIAGDYFKNENEEDQVIWCTSSPEEYKKCRNFAYAVPRDLYHFGDAALNFNCTLATSKDECMQLLDEEKADLTTVDAGEVFIAGRYHSLVPIMQEVYPGDNKYYYAVAVIKRGSLPEVQNLHDLRGKKACFAGVGSHAGWVIPVHTMMNRGGMEVIDCNNHVKSTINFFGPSCAVNSLIDKYNPIGDNSDKLCQLCIGKIPGDRCTPADPYAGFEGAFRCLVETGDIAFVKHTTVNEMLDTDLHFVGLSKDKFELLCLDGTRLPVHEYKSCNWGKVPSHAVLTTSAKSPEERATYQRFLLKAVEIYGTPYLNKTQYQTYDSNRNNNTRDNNNNNAWDNRYNDRDRDRDRDRGDRGYERGYERVPGEDRDNPRKWELEFENPNDLYNRELNPYDNDYYNKKNKSEAKLFETFHLFESAPKYGIRRNLLFQDPIVGLVNIEESQQTYGGFLGPALDLILNVRRCTVNRMVLCVTSDPEHEKCLRMKIAMKAQLLKPEMICYKGHSQIHCMQAIQNGNADVAVLDAGDVYTAGLHYNLIPFISEIYNLGKPEYYVVAVAKENDPSTELTFLKGKYTCHPGISTAAGWVIPLAYLISNGWIRSYGCDSVRAAAEYFTKSCVPGALSTEYNTGVPYDNLCDLCHGASFRYCRRDASEDYYGHTGAFKCLVEGGGHVAFIKHTTVSENVDGKRTQWWARNRLMSDYELLCPDGTRKRMHEYRKCNLGTAKANAIVTRGGAGYNETELNAFINLFIYAQQFYGRKESDEFSFSMFYTQEPFTDLIFQDATLQLSIIPEYERSYSAYLGKDFLRAKRIVDCHAGASTLSFSHLYSLLCLVFVLLSGGYFIQPR